MIMQVSKRQWITAALVAVYLYTLLPATAIVFYELYHLTGMGFIYWGYSAFKAAGYYFGIWEYQLLSCVLIGAAIVVIPQLIKKVRRDA